MTHTISVMTVLPPPRSWRDHVECGCVCESCVNNNSLHLHREIELLKRQLVDRDYHIVQMETRVLRDSHHTSRGSHSDGMREELRFWQEKYNRLYESHKKLQKVNQGLEDKLLKMVDKYETEKNSMTREIGDLTSRLVDARLTIEELAEENRKLGNDCNVAVHLLQCKPSNFVAHKFSSLPSDLQEKVKGRIGHRQKSDTTPPNELRTIRVPISTFPPTAMVYSVSKVPIRGNNGDSEEGGSSPDQVSAAILAKVLEERARERGAQNHRSASTDHKTTQTRPDVHFRQRRESSSSSCSDSLGCPRTRNGSTASSTETVI